jgi:hypothetical protein
MATSRFGVGSSIVRRDQDRRGHTGSSFLRTWARRNGVRGLRYKCGLSHGHFNKVYHGAIDVEVVLKCVTVIEEGRVVIVI